MARNGTPKRRNPEEGQYTVRRQMSNERYEATVEALRELDGAIGSVVIRKFAMKPGTPFETVTKHDGRNVTDIQKRPLAPGHVGVEVVTPVNAHRERIALEQRANEILATGITPQAEAVPLLDGYVPSHQQIAPQAPQNAPINMAAQGPVEVRPAGGGWDNRHP